MVQFVREKRWCMLRSNYCLSFFCMVSVCSFVYYRISRRQGPAFVPSGADITVAWGRLSTVCAIREWTSGMHDFFFLKDKPTKMRSNYYLGRLLCGTFLLKLQTEFCFFRSRFCPVKAGNRAGSSMNECEFSRIGTNTSLPLPESPKCWKCGLSIAPVSIFLLEKQVDQIVSLHHRKSS